MQVYGSKTPPSIDLTSIDDQVKIALFVGKQDELGTPAVGAWTREKVASNLVYYKDLDDWDHYTYSVGKDMSYFEDVL